MTCRHGDGPPGNCTSGRRRAVPARSRESDRPGTYPFSPCTARPGRVAAVHRAGLLQRLMQKMAARPTRPAWEGPGSMAFLLARLGPERLRTDPSHSVPAGRVGVASATIPFLTGELFVCPDRHVEQTLRPDGTVAYATKCAGPWCTVSYVSGPAATTATRVRRRLSPDNSRPYSLRSSRQNAHGSRVLRTRSPMRVARQAAAPEADHHHPGLADRPPAGSSTYRRARSTGRGGVCVVRWRRRVRR